MPKARIAAAALALLLAGCATPPQGRTPFDPTADMLAVLTAQAKLGARPVEQLTVEQARRNPSIADAVHVVQSQRGQPTAPAPIAGLRDISIPGAAGPIPARLYMPLSQSPGPKPVILYLHGGGWVISTIDTYDASARGLANGAGAIVLSVEYRKGPENRFPAAHDDANAAYRWLLAQARSFGGDPRRVAVAGESAGGNMAIDVALYARDARLPPPVHLLLVYPVAGTDLMVPSMVENAQAKPLSKAGVEWFTQHYANGPQDLKDPRLDVVGAAQLYGLPPTTIVLAQIDPLRSGGELLANKLAAANVPTEMRVYPGVTHEFFGTGDVVPTAQAAMGFATDRLRDAFANPPRETMATSSLRASRRRAPGL